MKKGKKKVGFNVPETHKEKQNAARENHPKKIGTPFEKMKSSGEEQNLTSPVLPHNVIKLAEEFLESNISEANEFLKQKLARPTSVSNLEDDGFVDDRKVETINITIGKKNTYEVRIFREGMIVNRSFQERPSIIILTANEIKTLANKQAKQNASAKQMTQPAKNQSPAPHPKQQPFLDRSRQRSPREQQVTRAKPTTAAASRPVSDTHISGPLPKKTPIQQKNAKPLGPTVLAALTETTLWATKNIFDKNYQNAINLTVKIQQKLQAIEGSNQNIEKKNSDIEAFLNQLNNQLPQTREQARSKQIIEYLQKSIMDAKQALAEKPVPQSTAPATLPVTSTQIYIYEDNMIDAAIHEVNTAFNSVMTYTYNPAAEGNRKRTLESLDKLKDEFSKIKNSNQSAQEKEKLIFNRLKEITEHQQHPAHTEIFLALERLQKYRKDYSDQRNKALNQFKQSISHAINDPSIFTFDFLETGTVNNPGMQLRIAIKDFNTNPAAKALHNNIVAFLKARGIEHSVKEGQVQPFIMLKADDLSANSVRKMLQSTPQQIKRLLEIRRPAQSLSPVKLPVQAQSQAPTKPLPRTPVQSQAPRGATGLPVTPTLPPSAPAKSQQPPVPTRPQPPAQAKSQQPPVPTRPQPPVQAKPQPTIPSRSQRPANAVPANLQAKQSFMPVNRTNQPVTPVLNNPRPPVPPRSQRPANVVPANFQARQFFTEGTTNQPITPALQKHQQATRKEGPQQKDLRPLPPRKPKRGI